jgi:hypothetical protein
VNLQKEEFLVLQGEQKHAQRSARLKKRVRRANDLHVETEGNHFEDRLRPIRPCNSSRSCLAYVQYVREVRVR